MLERIVFNIKRRHSWFVFYLFAAVMGVVVICGLGYLTMNEGTFTPIRGDVTKVWKSEFLELGKVSLVYQGIHSSVFCRPKQVRNVREGDFVGVYFSKKLKLSFVERPSFSGFLIMACFGELVFIFLVIVTYKRLPGKVQLRKS
ncbi:MAG: hypothetical protein ACPGWM_03975 [Flavobacteriales bacterium]